MRNTISTVLIFLAAIVLILGLLHYFKILALIALLIGFGVLIGAIIFIIVSVALLIFAVPYYLLAKKPKIDDYGMYTLEDVKGKEVDAKKKD
jgi:membrane protein implicated in regulation of membrane protease activity